MSAGARRGTEDELARLRSELAAVDSERRRLRVELEQIERSPLGSLIGPARTVRSVAGRYARRLRARLGPRLRARPVAPPGHHRNRRLAPQLSGSELAWLAGSRIRRQAARWSAGNDATRAGPWLTPILVDFFGRDGSTAIMALLATSPQIVVDDKYPYERRYFTYLWRWSRLLSRTRWPHALWAKEDVVSVAQEGEGSTLLGPPPWLPRPLLEAPGEPPIAQRCFELAWRELSRRATREDAGNARYYAEKHGNTWMADPRDLPPLKLIVLLRDPRDTYASMRAFEDAEPESGFGVHHVWGGYDRLAGILDRHRQRLRWISALQAEGVVPVIRYEELVSDPGGVAGRLERYLEVELDPEPLRDPALIARHATSTPEGSDRWRRELDPHTAERFNEELGPELAALDFAAK